MTDFKSRAISFKNITLSHTGDRLFKNASLLLAAKMVNALSGFLFWSIAARHYSIYDVGTATAILSSLGLVTVFSRVGLDVSMIRFMPSDDKNIVLNSTLWVTSILSVILSLIFLGGIEIISPPLAFLKDFAPIFIAFILINSFLLTFASAFIATRQGKYYLMQNIVLSLRVPILIPLTFAGGLGIILSIGVAYVLASIFSLMAILKNFKLQFGFGLNYIKTQFNYSMMNYVSSLFNMVPTLILPLIIINILGPEDSAQYYIAFTISSIVMMIPDSISTSFFVEGCYKTDLKKGAIRAMVASIILLIPVIAVFCFHGVWILGLFGKDYTDSSQLLFLFLISNIFFAFYNMFVSYVNIIKKVHLIVISDFFRCIALIGGSYLLLNQYGIIGVGYAWMITYIVLMIYAIICVYRLRGVRLKSYFCLENSQNKTGPSN